ncbi:MAG: vitamin K epoxide reductase family protein, partial [Muribaculaceae bacterium]|nr:vitamin K epoxide reductase family protein [Muribaculaceae bacterium]
MTIFYDWLRLLGVPCTRAYSEEKFRSMSFPSLFGLSKLMQSYGVGTLGVRLADKSLIGNLPVPFVAPMAQGDMVIVTSVGPDVEYLSVTGPGRTPVGDFLSAWSGAALLARTTANSIEPEYRRHRFAEVMTRLRDVGVWIALAAVFVYMFVAHGLEGRWYTVALTVLNIGGLVLSFMLVQKTVGVHNRIQDRVCGVLQDGGCDDILATRASSFFGIFHWSEVGMSYFGVSLATLLLFPDRLTDLALINVCCLPYTVWSITYQRFVAHRWCTMCVGVQATLWLLFFCYLGGGCFRGAWPLHLSFFALGAVYIATLLVLNK